MQENESQFQHELVVARRRNPSESPRAQSSTIVVRSKGSPKDIRCTNCKVKDRYWYLFDDECDIGAAELTDERSRLVQ